MHTSPLAGSCPPVSCPAGPTGRSNYTAGIPEISRRLSTARPARSQVRAATGNGLARLLARNLAHLLDLLAGRQLLGKQCGLDAVEESL